jgi:hypothetical protein
MPRPNPHKTTVATLRSHIEKITGRPYPQAMLAKRARCARISIQAVERGKLALSVGLASRISEGTGVAADWLLHGSPTSKPLDCHGEVLSRETWLAHDSDLREGTHARTRHAINPIAYSAPIAGVAQSAMKAGKLPLFIAELRDAITTLRARFGEDKEATEQAAVHLRESCSPAWVMDEDFAAASGQADRLRRWNMKAYGALPVEEGEADLSALLALAQVASVAVEVKSALPQEKLFEKYPALQAKKPKATKSPKK